MAGNELVKKITQTDLTSFLAWGSISYAFGFVIVMLHTARLGFPILELLSAVYVWIGAPLTVVAFFSIQIARFFRSRSVDLTSQLRDSWKDFRQDVDTKDLDVISAFLGFLGTLFPVLKLFRRPLEWLLKLATAGHTVSGKRAVRFLHRFASFIRGVQALFEFLRLFNLAVSIVFGVYLYVWHLYPLIPQSFGGGAPTAVKLIVNVEKVPPSVPGLPGIREVPAGGESQKSAVTGTVKLLYSTKDQYYLEGAEGARISLSKSAVEGMIWNPEN